ncbi:MAG: hypothetical protein ACM3YM_12815 [Sphingomonadales bacterium]
MGTGVQRLDAQPEEATEASGEEELSLVGTSEQPDAEWVAEAPQPSRSIAVRLLGAVLILLGIAWIAGAGWVAAQSSPSVTPQAAITWIPALCVPLILLALVWQLAGRTSRRETERFSRAVAAMRNESASLESLLGVVSARLEENHARLTSEAAKLMSLGDEAADRLGRVAHYLAKESVNLDSKSEALESAAAAARVDIGVLMSDLPRAEEQALAVARAMKEAGLDAHSQAGALESQLSALIARGREADEVVGGTAQRLAAHLVRIEGTTAAASSRIDEAAVSMNAAVDSTMSRAAEAVDAARAGLEAQGAAMLAMIEQSRAALERAGEDAGRNLGQRLDTIGSKIEGLADHLAAQDAASHALVNSLSHELAQLDEKFVQLADTGLTRTEGLETSISAVRRVVSELLSELNSGTDRAGDLISHAHDMARALTAMAQQLDQEVPAALIRVEQHAGRAHAATSAIAPEIEAIRSAAEIAAARLTEAEANIASQRTALDSLIARLGEGLASAEEQLRSLSAATDEADGAARRLVHESSPELVEALLRVRETAHQAAERAREAIAAVIPESAAKLGDAGREAVKQAISSTVNEQLGLLTELAERAVATARRASDRLTRQMLAIGKTTAAIEARIDESERAREEEEAQNLSRRVALLMESLNSTAIDVTKLLSNEVTDTAWTAYLKGDRGVFTRRAVRLLSSGEARAIVQHYEEEPEFREQVNRYIHDFEAMLRRVLADREGSALGITLLSSDMGKLYVALAQAIERLR